MAILGQFRGDLRSNWESVNPVIHDREFILVKETANGPWTGYKVGDGVNKFNALPYGSNISILQVIGTSETATMSQKAISDNLYWVEIEAVNYFFGSVTVDFDAKTVNIGSGYFSTGKSAFAIAAQSGLTWSSPNAHNIRLNLTDRTVFLQDIAVPTTVENSVVIGTIDMTNKKVRMNNPKKFLGKYGISEKRGYFMGVNSIIDITFNVNPTTKSWNLKLSSGYLMDDQGNNILNMPSANIDMPDGNLAYLFADTQNGAWVCYPYYQKPTKEFSYLYFMGIINPNDSTYILNAAHVKVNGTEVVRFTKEEQNQLANVNAQLGTSETSYLPSENWLSKAWNSELTVGNTYVDKSCIISKEKQLKSVKIIANKAGTLGINLISVATNQILYTQNVNVVVGENVFTIGGITYSQNMYVGVTGGTGTVKTIFPNDGNVNGYKLENGSLTYIGYSMAYQLALIDYSNTLEGRVSALEEEIGQSGGDDINDMLSKSDVVTLAPRDYIITSPIILQSGKTLKGSFGKTRLIIQAGVECAIKATSVNDIEISDLEIVGNQVDYKYAMNGIIEDPSYNTVVTEDDAINFAYMGNENGIYLASCEKVVLQNLKIRNVTGSALRVNRVGRDYIWGLKACNLFISNCYNGIYGENEHEYSEYTNFSVTLCMIGIYFNSGNLIFTAGHCTRNRVAMMLKEGYNHAHGICNGIELKHNQIAGLLCKDVTYGEFFQGMYVSYCGVIMRDCSGLYFDSLMMGNGGITCSNEAGVSGKNMIVNLARRSNSVTINNTGNLEVINTRDLF